MPGIIKRKKHHMRIYLNCQEAITDIGRELKKCATTVHTQTMQNKEIADDPDYLTKEIQGFEFCIIETNDKDAMPNVTLEWAKAEFAERIAKEHLNPGYAWKLRPEVWTEFLVDGKFEYTYNERMSWQIDPVVRELVKHPDTRQAIIEIHDRGIDTERMGKMRVPCSMFYHLMIRNGKLDVIYVMRSTDFATHFQNDIWLADELRRYIAKRIDVPVGKFFMVASSLHIYKKDWDTLSNY